MHRFISNKLQTYFPFGNLDRKISCTIDTDNRSLLIFYLRALMYWHIFHWIHIQVMWSVKYVELIFHNYALGSHTCLKCMLYNYEFQIEIIAKIFCNWGENRCYSIKIVLLENFWSSILTLSIQTKLFKDCSQTGIIFLVKYGQS